ncbi:circularly permuted type 2 ATP-grasp protein [Cohnella lubricantis]|uniref:Circularly permuted type 2 ATP-grasp protein n=1 Tax=Cohnella lubricantis TaxID=2163172 RepID=A0A841TCL4_9BACL|nr:circularly permuted type 2 ATP-grasp protein [Cohnella lubricantis]MBB6676717.1 circularly permuted type 2 ATP-grasp protein [Cohnella lubricantis]MBP2117763.1 putative circularly permuted ATP-grasp superfamily protein [Cohnella lubricantis]
MELWNAISSLPPSPTRFYDEMFSGQAVRPHYERVQALLSRLSFSEREARQAAMNRRLLEEGITFTLAQADQPDALERTIPFDFLPRILTAEEWDVIERGVSQRVRALNAFLRDVYHDQNIFKDGLIPRRMVLGNRYFRTEMMRMSVPAGTYITASGIDLIRDEQGRFFVLEDNLRSPSGFSYIYKSRSIMTHDFPEMYFSYPVRGLDRSLGAFRSALRHLAPGGKSDPVIALLTPGSFNSAYFEHAFLAQQMGLELVEGRDLVCRDHKIYIRSLNGLKRVDVLYRRIDDDFLDPLAFRPDSLLGVAGLMNAYRFGNVAIANAPGTGVADDKAIYSFVPEMIRYYLNEKPILANVPTYLMSRPEEREYVLERLDQMVVKETALSGGYGMLIGPSSTERERERFAEKIRDNPDNYIAQPTIQLSTAPVVLDGKLVSRHIDLRVFAISDGPNVHVLPGGLTRVAMREGSLVVNSSQGGGCKDTWVLAR